MVSRLLAAHCRIEEPFLLWPQGWSREFYQCIIVQHNFISIYFSAEWLLVGGLSPKWLQSDIWLRLAVCCRYFQELGSWVSPCVFPCIYLCLMNYGLYFQERGRVLPCVFPCIYLRLMNYGLVHPFRLSHIRGLSCQPICSCWLHQRIINIFFN